MNDRQSIGYRTYQKAINIPGELEIRQFGWYVSCGRVIASITAITDTSAAKAIRIQARTVLFRLYIMYTIVHGLVRMQTTEDH